MHVCRRWRNLIFVSPRRLNLQLFCNSRKPVRKSLGIWPAIHIAVCGILSYNPIEQDNLLAALEHRDRVRTINLGMTSSQVQLDKVAIAMQAPFLALTLLRLTLTRHRTVQILPDGFLGDSAPCLREIHLTGVSFPALPTFLLSTSDLTDLHLYNTSPTSIPPEAMATGLAATTRLKALTIEFHSAASLPHQSPITPPTRAVLPALSRFQFRGDSKYLEDLVALIDCPRLKCINVSYSNLLLDVHVSQLFRFIALVENFKLTRFRRARIRFYDQFVYICIEALQTDPHPSHLTLQFPYRRSNSQVQSTRQHLVQSSAMLTTVRHLTVATLCGGFLEEDGDYAEWLELIRLFPTVEALHFGGELAILIDPILDDLTKEMVADVLPALRFLNIDGQMTRSVKQFIAARQLSMRPVTIVKTQKEFEMLEARCGGAGTG